MVLAEIQNDKQLALDLHDFLKERIGLELYGRAYVEFTRWAYTRKYYGHHDMAFDIEVLRLNPHLVKEFEVHSEPKNRLMRKILDKKDKALLFQNFKSFTRAEKVYLLHNF